jgi:outer membrane protein OmpA-like peptidoglycan-associated protein
VRRALSLAALRLAALVAPALAARSAGAQDPVVSARQVYLACRWAARPSDAPGGAPAGPAKQTVEAFCRDFQLPTARRARLSATWARAWALRGVPEAKVIEDFARKQAEDDKAAAAAAATARLDLPEGRFEFGPGSAVLSGADSARVRTLAAFLLAHPGLRLDVTGYASAAPRPGDDRVNTKLAALRALAVQGALLAADVPPDRIHAQSYGYDAANEKEVTAIARAAARPQVPRERLAQVAVIGATPQTVARSATSDVLAASVVRPGSAPGAATPGDARAAAVAAPRATARGGVDVSTILIGVTDFVLAKASAQVQAYAVGQVGRTLCTPISPPRDSLNFARAYLGETCRLFDTAAVAQYRPGLGTFRVAMRRDLGTLPDRVIRLGLQGGALVDPSRAEVAAAVLYTLRTLERIERGADPVLLVARDGGAAWASDVLGTKPLGASVRGTAARMAGFLSAVEFAKLDLPEVWASGGGVTADSVLTYAARAFAVNERPNLEKHVAAVDSLSVLVGPLWENALRVYELAAVIDSARRDLADAGRWGAGAESYGGRVARYAGLVAASADLVEAATLWAPGVMPEANLARARDLAADARALSVAAATERYVDAAAALLRLVEGVAPLESNPTARERYRVALRVVAFAGDVAQAEDASGVGQALERFSSPDAGVRRKRAPARSPFAYLNAYAGALAGRETVGGPGAAAFAGPTLPVGVELGRSCGSPEGDRRWYCWGRRRVGSVSLFLPLVDLGAVAATRLQSSDDVRSTQAVTLSQVLTPGAYVVWGLRGTFPLSFGVGATRVANARERPDGRRLDATRVGALVGLDVPLFP